MTSVSIPSTISELLQLPGLDSAVIISQDELPERTMPWG